MLVDRASGTCCHARVLGRIARFSASGRSALPGRLVGARRGAKAASGRPDVRRTARTDRSFVMRPLIKPVSAVVCHLLLWGVVAAAQEKGAPPPAPSPPPVAAAAEPAAGPIRPDPLGPYHLVDEDGKLKTLLGDWTYEEFRAMYDQFHGLRQASEIPDYTIESLLATGQVQGEVAELKVRLALVLRADHWLKIPLALGEAAIRRPPDEEGARGPLLTIEEQHGKEDAPAGYVLWMRGGPQEQKRQVELDLLVPVQTLGSQSRLVLSMPRVTSSELRLTVPGENVVAESSNGAIVQTPQQLGDGTTQLTVRGLRGDLQLSWRQSHRAGPADGVVVASVGTILATVERSGVQWDARLVLRGYGGVLEHVRVRLPAGAKLTEEEDLGYTVEDVTPKGRKEAEGRIVEIRFSGPVKEGQTAEVRLAARQAGGGAGPAARFDLSGFEVMGAVRQSGFLGISASADWNIRFDEGPGVRQVGEVPEPLSKEQFVAKFEYFDQPFSLAARVFPRQTRISVDPRYTLLIDKDVVRLEATLKYSVRGKKVDDLFVEMPGWELDGVGPEETVVTEGVELDESDVLPINLIESALGEFEVTVRAHQPVARDATSLSLTLPRPRVGSQSPAAVFVVPADNVELVPDAKATVGLVRQQVAPPVKLPERQQKPWFYRGETSEAVFAARFRVHQQSITVECSSEVALARKGGQRKQPQAEVKERLVYDVKYEATQSLLLEVPAALAESDALELVYAGEPITAVDPIDQSQKPPRSGVVLKQVVLPGPAKGRCELQVRFSVTLDELEPLASSLWPIPLVMPAEGELTANSVFVTAEPGLRLASHENHWQVMEAEAVADGEGDRLRLTTQQRTAKVMLQVNLEDPDTFGSTVVEQAWIQTWLADGRRRDRAVFRLRSDRKHLELKLPDGVEAAAVTASVDGVEVPVETSPQGRTTVELPRPSAAHSVVLEIWYPFSQPRPPRGEVLLQFPRLGPKAWTRRTYWQLILPRDEHVILPPGGWTPEFRWGWTGTYWGRLPVKEQPELELWVGAKQETPVPLATSRYLFSGFAEAGQARFRTAGRIWIVGWASGSVLLAGLLLIYVPAVRRPLPVFVFLVGLVAAAVAFPTPMLLLGQAAGMGLAMALLGGILYRGVARHRPWVAPREGSSSVLERGSTQLHYTPAKGEGAATTATMTKAAPAGSPQS